MESRIICDDTENLLTYFNSSNDLVNKVIYSPLTKNMLNNSFSIYLTFNKEDCNIKEGEFYSYIKPYIELSPQCGYRNACSVISNVLHANSKFDNLQLSLTTEWHSLYYCNSNIHTFDIHVNNFKLSNERFNEIKSIFNYHCINTYINTDDVKVFYKCSGDTFGHEDRLEYNGSLYIFAEDKEVIRQSIIALCLMCKTSDCDHTFPISIDEYFKLAESISKNEIDIETYRKEALSSFLTRYRTNVIKELEDSVTNLNRTLEHNLNCYRDYMNQLKDANDKLLVNRDSSQNACDQLAMSINKYIKNGLLLDYREWDSKSLNLIVRAPLYNYNEDIAKKILSNPIRYGVLKESFAYKLFEQSLKEDSKYSIVFTTSFRMNMFNYDFRTTSIISNTTSRAISNVSSKIFNGLPNPHLAFFNCWGQNAPTLINLLKDNNYDEFFICLSATIGNLNLGDVAVFTRFTQMLNTIGESNNNIKFILNKETKTLLSKKEFLGELKHEAN